jgi:hypothetical protein
MTTTTSSSLTVRPMDEPDERLEPPLARIDMTTLQGITLVRIVVEPGWRWSTSMGPIAGTATCQVPHVGYVLRGRLHILTDAGEEGELGAGDAFTMGAGHDGWVVGDEPVEFLEIVTAEGSA